MNYLELKTEWEWVYGALDAPARQVVTDATICSVCGLPIRPGATAIAAGGVPLLHITAGECNRLTLAMDDGDTRERMRGAA